MPCLKRAAKAMTCAERSRVHLGLVTTSWPTAGMPWAGHFVADLAQAIAGAGHLLTVVAPVFLGDERLEERAGITLIPARTGCHRKHLPTNPRAWPAVLMALKRATGSVSADAWMAHWWPSLLVVPRGARTLTVLHGSDVDLLEKLPRPVTRWIERRSQVLAVAPRLAQRFELHGAQQTPTVCPMGAREDDAASSLPASAIAWASASAPKVLTVARPARGKGREVVMAAQRLLPGVRWLLAGSPQLHPREVRRLLASADLCVIPSQEGASFPGEGRPHIIAQAMVAGVPCVGGPNRAVRDAMRAFEQVDCPATTADELAQHIREALIPATHQELRRRARDVGKTLRWDHAVTSWIHAIHERAPRA